MGMWTVARMLLLVFEFVGLSVWYLSYHPRPLSNEDSVFLVVVSLTSVWVAYLIWRIDCLKDDLAEFKQKATDATDFIGIFVHPSRVKDVLASMAGGLQGSFGVALRLQQECQDDVMEELKMVQATVERDKAHFWRAVELGHRLMGIQPKKLYKHYLPTSSWQGGIPAEKA